jgi:hypothetical protein
MGRQQPSFTLTLPGERAGQHPLADGGIVESGDKPRGPWHLFRVNEWFTHQLVPLGSRLPEKDGQEPWGLGHSSEQKYPGLEGWGQV